MDSKYTGLDYHYYFVFVMIIIIIMVIVMISKMISFFNFGRFLYL